MGAEQRAHKLELEQLSLNKTSPNMKDPQTSAIKSPINPNYILKAVEPGC